MTHSTQTDPKQGGKWADEAGMTLLEVMIATGIMVIAFLLTMGSVVSISTAGAVSENQARAAAEAASVMEELRSLPFEELVTYQPPPREELPIGTGVSVACFDGDGGAHVLPFTSASMAAGLPNPLQVQVTVFWQDKSGRSLSTRTSAMLGR